MLQSVFFFLIASSRSSFTIYNFLGLNNESPNDSFNSTFFSTIPNQNQSHGLNLSTTECKNLTNRKAIKTFYQNKQCPTNDARRAEKNPNDK